MFGQSNKKILNENQELKSRIKILEDEVLVLKNENADYAAQKDKVNDIVQENKLKNALTQNLTNGCIDNIGFVQKEIEANMEKQEEIN
ncbi:MAG: hypothetical protein J7J96_02480, partial [Sulfurimonas sp.]|nr:hypothetical protein [Sulfurimonas sp.]